jgi:hypothetical protein
VKFGLIQELTGHIDGHVGGQRFFGVTAVEKFDRAVKIAG